MEPVKTFSRHEGAEIREAVRERYSQSALRVKDARAQAGCCGTASGEACCGGEADPVSANLYSEEESSQVPNTALLASLGCGNPTALAQLHPGETVLDLGSGGGIDVLLSAKRVGPSGFAYGLDMTDEMLALAEENRTRSGLQNVRFLKGYIEQIPLPDAAVDVAISNCVINLSADKAKVINEAFRVLKPGGRFAVSDIVTQGQIPAELRADMEAWTGCIAGALPEEEYTALLREAGFKDVSIEVTRRYSAEDLSASVGCCGAENVAIKQASADGQFVSAFIRATKPEQTAL